MMRLIHHAFFISLITLSTSVALAQDVAVIDVAVTADPSNLVPPGIKSSVEVSVQNVDSFPIPMGDTLYISAVANGSSMMTVIVLDSTLDTNEILTFNFGPENLVTMPTSTTNFYLSASLLYSGDTIMANNIYDEPFVVTDSVENDWSCTDVDVLEPSGLDGFDIDNGTNVPPSLSSVRVNFQNIGDVHYLRWSSFSYSISLGTDSSFIDVSLDMAAMPVGATMERLVTNQVILPALPDSVGNYELCTAPNVTTDPNPSNDIACFEFEIVDNYDPFDPLNWPKGIEDSDIEALLGNWNCDGITFQYAALEDQSISVWNTHGALVGKKDLNAGSQFNLNDLNAGVYILTAESAIGNFSAKFVIAGR